jgi:hypothetical protein
VKGTQLITYRLNPQIKEDGVLFDWLIVFHIFRLILTYNKKGHFVVDNQIYVYTQKWQVKYFNLIDHNVYSTALILCLFANCARIELIVSSVRIIYLCRKQFIYLRKYVIYLCYHNLFIIVRIELHNYLYPQSRLENIESKTMCFKHRKDDNGQQIFKD